MHSHISISGWLIWFAVTAGQALTLLLAVRRRERSLTLYLALEIACSAIGMCVARWGSAHSFFVAYVADGMIDGAISCVLLFAWLNRMRLRARVRWQSCSLVSGWAAVAFVFVLILNRSVAAHLTPSPWDVSNLSSHLAWAWLAIMIGTVPVYCFLTGSVPDRRLAFFLLGLGIYTAVHAGLVSALLLRVTTNAPILQCLKLVSDCSYFFSLGLWSAALTGLPINNPAKEKSKGA